MEGFLKQRPTDLPAESFRRQFKYSFDKVDVNNSKTPQFAVVLSTDAAGHSAGLKFFHILSADTTDEDFHLLLKREADLVRKCMTRSQMRFFLADKDETLIHRRAGTEGYAHGWLEHLEEHARLLERYWSGNISAYEYHTCEKKVRDVFVDVSLKSQWKNLEEKRIAFSINIYATERRRQVYRSQRYNLS